MAKFYAVKNGREPGVYTSWDDCKKQVDGYSNAVFKSFKTEAEAQSYMQAKDDADKPVQEASNSETASHKAVVKPSSGKHVDIYVDGSYNDKLNQYGCGVYMIDQSGQKAVLLANGQCNDGGRNIEGEVFATVHAVNFAVEHGYHSIDIYHDYQGIGSWADKQWSANKNYTRNYADHIDAMRNCCNIRFVHVDGHTGNEGNEYADKLSKLSCGVPMSNSDMNKLISDMKEADVYKYASVDLSSCDVAARDLGDSTAYVSRFYSNSPSDKELALSDVCCDR